MESESTDRMSELSKGNKALRGKKYAVAIEHYIRAMFASLSPALPHTLFSDILSRNVQTAAKRYRAERFPNTDLRVAVSGWELSHNAAGRAYTLAKFYESMPKVAEVEIIGSHFPAWGTDIWEPIRDTGIRKHSFVADDESHFLEQAIILVGAHPYDVIHLSKPRMPNILFGLLYKLIWNVMVLVDIDDEELTFVDPDTAIDIGQLFRDRKDVPELYDMTGKTWTRIGVGLAQAFDGVTVSNPALQHRYGGCRHSSCQG